MVEKVRVNDVKVESKVKLISSFFVKTTKVHQDLLTVEVRI